MAETQRAQSSAQRTSGLGAAGEGSGLGVGEGFATRSLGDSSLPVNFHGNLASAESDEELLSLLQRAKASKRPAVVTYGAPWCHACRHMLPTFCNLSNDYESASFIYADVDKCYETTRDVRYTPTFRFYRDGEKVDEFYGAGPQRLRDRVWLHT
ncbi:hypothetical protein KC19_7G074400 [Ceratodon purpureus]|uniref:Thioredoxin domain-containing protein n=1 Tax=Ceratodon purpureus TaxID=3225 RepID=A0A8T0H3C9_CERPU|nr:hypothetical protein KC19_7G074400 [Ceratodon purpureus]